MKQTGEINQNKQKLQNEIKILGTFSTNFKSKHLNQPYETIELTSEAITMRSYRPQGTSLTTQAYDISPVRIWSEGNLLAFLDQHENLWMISDIFPNHVNVSTLLYRKIKNVFLSENQCIISNKKKPILLNWGAKKVIDIENLESVRINERQLQFSEPIEKSEKRLMKRQMPSERERNRDSNFNKSAPKRLTLLMQKAKKRTSQPKLQKTGGYFKAFFINSATKEDIFYYNNQRKVQNSNKLYQLSYFNQKEEDSEQCQKNNTNVSGFPTGELISMRTKIIGISVGKFHCMMWDADGFIYTWGTRSIALGFQKLPREKVITKPRKLQSLSNKFITMGFAGTHYSLALSSDGILYQWGIKKQPNQLNEELIFEPTPVIFNENPSARIILLRGKCDNYACLGSNGQFYIWGKKAANFIPEPTQSSNNINQLRPRNNRIYPQIHQPSKITCFNHCKIVDFTVQQNYIAILTANAQSKLMIEEQKKYWEQMISRVKEKLEESPKKPKLTKIKTEQTDTTLEKNHKKSMLGLKRYTSVANENEPIQFFNFSKAEPMELCHGIQKAYYDRETKKEYFKSLKNEKLFFNSICIQEKSNSKSKISSSRITHVAGETFLQNIRRVSQENQIKNQNHQLAQNSQKPCQMFIHLKTESDRISENHQKNLQIQNRFSSSYQNCSQLNKSLLLTKNSNFLKKSYTGRPLNTSQTTFRAKNINFEVNDARQYLNHFYLENKKNKEKENQKMLMMSVRNAKNYEDMLKKIEQSKNSKQKYSIRLKKVKEKKKSIEETCLVEIAKKVEENSIQFRAEKHEQILRNKIHEKNRQLLKSTLQAYLIKKYLVRAYASVIQPARKIKIERFGRNVRLARIQRNLRKVFINAKASQGMKKLLKCNLITYAKLCYVFRGYVKRWRARKVANHKKTIAQEIYKSILRQKIKFGISKAHLTVRKLQKLREWLVMTQVERIKCLKILWRNHLLNIMKVTNENDATGILKPVEDCSFEGLYNEKIALNPLLKLENFLNKTPIFSLRHQYFQSIIFLFQKDSKVKSQKNIKKVVRKQRIKFSGQGISISPYSALQSNDLLPYSLHYNLFTRKKAIDLNLTDNLRRSQKWMMEERRVFENCLKQIIKKHDRGIIMRRRKYDLQLAYFIKEQFESLSQKRWKCILEYNQLKITSEKKKKQKELFRLFDLIGMRKTLIEDCLPQKYLILQEAIKRKDSPPPPSPYISFGLSQFRQIFKQKYFDVLASRAKAFRRNHI